MEITWCDMRVMILCKFHFATDYGFLFDRDKQSRMRAVCDLNGGESFGKWFGYVLLAISWSWLPIHTKSVITACGGWSLACRHQLTESLLRVLIENAYRIVEKVGEIIISLYSPSRNIHQQSCMRFEESFRNWNSNRAHVDEKLRR